MRINLSILIYIYIYIFTYENEDSNPLLHYTTIRTNYQIFQIMC